MLTPDFKEFARLLAAHRVEYLIVGGYALAIHGHPRYTGDLDFWVGHDPGNAGRVLEDLEAFGFGGMGITQADLSTPGRVIQLGYPPTRIDLLTSIDGVDFAAARAARIELMVDGLLLPFISLEDFCRNKLATGRLKDLADLESLDALPPASDKDADPAS